MRIKIKEKYLISITEGILFLLLLVFAILTIFDLLSIETISYSEFFALWDLKITIILLVLFVLFPYFLILIKNIGEKATNRYNIGLFKRKFFEEIKQKHEINILDLSQKYNVNLLFVKNYLRDQLSQGFLKGELKEDIFYIKEGFKALEGKQNRITFFKKNLGSFIAPYQIIKLKEISSNFGVPKNIVKIYMTKLINEKALKGYFEKDTFYRDLSLSEEMECPYCKKKFNPKEQENSI